MLKLSSRMAISLHGMTTAANVLEQAAKFDVTRALNDRTFGKDKDT
jgi:hypothetical protein